MNLKDRLALVFNSGCRSGFLEKLRVESFESFLEKGFPTVRDEEWKYTDLKVILKDQYDVVFSKNEEKVTREIIESFQIAHLDSHKLIFINGKLDESLSDKFDGISVVSVSEKLFRDSFYQEVFTKKYNSLLGGFTSLTDLNTAFVEDILFITVDKNKIISKPVELLHLTLGKETPKLVQTRNFILIEENAQVMFIERYRSLWNISNFNNVVTEIFLDQNAVVDFYKIQNDQKSVSLIDSVFIAQERDTTASFHTFSFGGKMTRNNLLFYQNQSGCQSNLNGVSILGDHQLVDNHTLVHHKAPDCNSNENYKGIYRGNSRGIFNGKILVDRLAQKISAYQQNDSLLLSKEAVVNSKPQLEIFADDVKCSHGCTIGQFEESILFYIRQRGIPLRQAEELIMAAFFENIIEKITMPELKQEINRLIFEKINNF